MKTKTRIVKWNTIVQTSTNKLDMELFYVNQQVLAGWNTIVQTSTNKLDLELFYVNQQVKSTELIRPR